MNMPLGFKTSNPHKVCRLYKSLYGLKQALRQWFAKLASKFLEYGFINSYVDYSLFSYKQGDKFMALLVYLDDLVLTVNDSDLCASFKKIPELMFSS